MLLIATLTNICRGMDDSMRTSCCLSLVTMSISIFSLGIPFHMPLGKIISFQIVLDCKNIQAYWILMPFCFLCSEIKEVRKKKERAKELEGIDTSNIVSSTRRRSTASYVAPPKPKIPVESESEESEDEDDEDDDDDEDNDENGNNDASQSEESNVGKSSCCCLFIFIFFPKGIYFQGFAHGFA